MALRARARLEAGIGEGAPGCAGGVPSASATCRRTLSTSRGLKSVSAIVHPQLAANHSRCHAAAGDEAGTGERGGGADEASDSGDDDDILSVPNLG